MAKASADYDRKLRYAQADLDAFAKRLKISQKELDRLLSNVPERERIAQLVTRHAVNLVDHANASEAVARYQRLVDARDAEANAAAAQANAGNREAS